MVEEPPHPSTQTYIAICECCKEVFSGFYGVSGIIYKFAKEHEDNCFKKQYCLR